MCLGMFTHFKCEFCGDELATKTGLPKGMKHFVIPEGPHRGQTGHICIECQEKGAHGTIPLKKAGETNAKIA